MVLTYINNKSSFIFNIYADYLYNRLWKNESCIYCAIVLISLYPWSESNHCDPSTSSPLSESEAACLVCKIFFIPGTNISTLETNWWAKSLMNMIKENRIYGDCTHLAKQVGDYWNNNHIVNKRLHTESIKDLHKY
jgi:hypothetical protein